MKAQFIPATHIGQSDQVLGSRFQPDSVSAVVDAWRVIQLMEGLCLPFR